MRSSKEHVYPMFIPDDLPPGAMAALVMFQTAMDQGIGNIDGRTHGQKRFVAAWNFGDSFKKGAAQGIVTVSSYLVIGTFAASGIMWLAGFIWNPGQILAYGAWNMMIWLHAAIFAGYNTVVTGTFGFIYGVLVNSMLVFERIVLGPQLYISDAMWRYVIALGRPYAIALHLTWLVTWFFGLAPWGVYVLYRKAKYYFA